AVDRPGPRSSGAANDDRRRDAVSPAAAAADGHPVTAGPPRERDRPARAGVEPGAGDGPPGEPLAVVALERRDRAGRARDGRDPESPAGAADAPPRRDSDVDVRARSAVRPGDQVGGPVRAQRDAEASVRRRHGMADDLAAASEPDERDPGRA